MSEIKLPSSSYLFFDLWWYIFGENMRVNEKKSMCFLCNMDVANGVNVDERRCLTWMCLKRGGNSRVPLCTSRIFIVIVFVCTWSLSQQIARFITFGISSGAGFLWVLLCYEQHDRLAYQNILHLLSKKLAIWKCI